MISDAERAFHEKWGYTDLEIVDGNLCALSKFIFTWGVIIGLTPAVIGGRYCFDTKQNAVLFYEDYKKSSGQVVPVVGIDGCTAIKI